MAVENYLLSIFHLQEQGIRVTSTNLANQLRRLPEGEGLGTSLPSVTGMLRRMVREKLVGLTSSKDIELTPKGQKSAESIIRRHRLAERMLVDLLGLELYKAHVEAHKLEHAISSDVEKKISKRLGNPTTCPFGHPIPGSGHITPKNTKPLSHATENQKLIIDRIPEDDQTLLKYFVDNGMHPGNSVHVIQTASYRGVIKLTCGAEEIEVSYEIADRIWVR